MSSSFLYVEVMHTFRNLKKQIVWIIFSLQIKFSLSHAALFLTLFYSFKENNIEKKILRYSSIIGTLKRWPVLQNNSVSFTTAKWLN